MALLGLGGARPKPYTSPLKTTYDSAASQQASDYDHIMQGYRDVGQNARNEAASGSYGGNTTANFTKLNPNLLSYMPDFQYSRGGDLQGTISNLQNTAKTGGYSDNDLYSLRERGISPIRSVYANAERNLSRQRALSGGNMSNYGAVAAKMAREQAGQIGEATNRTNADIATMVATGKQNANQLLAPLLERENALSNETRNRSITARGEVDARNAAERSRVEAHNAEIEKLMNELATRNAERNTNTQLDALHGQQSLYGTTPALTNLFGNQVLQNNQQNLEANRTANMIKNQRSQMGINLAQNQLGRA
jgi:hypothetical protein